MIKYPSIMRRANKCKSLTAYLISSGIVVFLSLNATQAFSKAKDHKKTNTSTVKAHKHEIAKAIKSSKADKKLVNVKLINKKHLKEAPALKSASIQTKHKAKLIHSAKASAKHELKKYKHHPIELASESESETTENNERIHSLIPQSSNETISSHAVPVDNTIMGSIVSVHGVIDQSLSESATDSGLSNELIEQLTSIFAWDIDFANNLDQGDKYTLVYEQETDSSDAQIVAAEFTNRGRILTALRYTTPDGTINYFSPEGKPMRKSFLSAPLDYLKISSGFSTHRKHPILNRIRAHKGVDYAARTGTPVKSAGDGEVSFLGNQGGYGQMLIIKHGEHYETVYAHLSDFKDGLESGDTVKQGEVIGYVGQSGLATGPHLHYEFRVDGEHRNPEALHTAQAQAQAEPLHDEILADFKDQTKASLIQLNKTKAQSLLAKN